MNETWRGVIFHEQVLNRVTGPQSHLGISSATYKNLCGLQGEGRGTITDKEVLAAIGWVKTLKVRSHMRGADAGGGGRKIGFNTNH